MLYICLKITKTKWNLAKSQLKKRELKNNCFQAGDLRTAFPLFFFIAGHCYQVPDSAAAAIFVI